MKDKSKQNTLLIYYLNGIIIAPIYFFMMKDILLEVAIGLSVFIGIILPSFGWFLFYLNTYYAINHHHKKPILFMVIITSFIYLIPAGIISYNIVIKKNSMVIANLQQGNTKFNNQNTVNGIRCPKCNNFNIGKSSFCIQCGYRLK